MEILNNEQSKITKAFFVLLIVLSLYFVVRIFSEIKKDNQIGESSTPATITFSGHGEVQAVPDIANVSFTIDKKDKTISSAQADVATVEKSSLSFLATNNVASADIQTTNASFNPTYEYQNAVCPQPEPMSSNSVAVPSVAVYCPSGKQVLTGYEATESITLKIRNLDTVGAIMQGLGGLGVTDLSGPNFAIDNPDAVQAQARKLAIADAQAKAKVLASDLGVSLGKITSFSENGNSSPIMYANAMVSGAVAPSATPAVIPAGQNTITSDVSITYEIK